MEKLFCRVDETGQDTKGELFIVGVVNVSNLEQAIKLAEQLEQRRLGRYRNRGLRKWIQLKDEEQLAYIRLLLATDFFKGCLFYKVYRTTTLYPQCTVDATIESIKMYVGERIVKIDVRVDGLTEGERRFYATNLRRAKLRTDKIRGGKDETDALIRLADALCGFARAAQLKREFAEVLERAEKMRFISRIGK